MEKFDLNIVTGRLGAGKTTTSKKIEAKLGVPRMAPNVMRRIMGIDEYSREDTGMVMSAIWDRIEAALRDNQEMTLCTGYVSRIARDGSYQMLRALSDYLEREVQAVLIRCECSEETSRSRISERGGFSLGDFDPKAYDRVKAKDQPITLEEMEGQPNISFLSFDTEANRITPLAVREHHGKAVQRLISVIL